MMTPQRLTPELSKNVKPSPASLRSPSRALCLLGLLSTLACKGTIDEQQTESLLPDGRGTGSTNAGAAPGNAAPAAGSPTGTGAEGEDQVGDNISGLDSDSDSARRSGGVRRRTSGRDREDVDAGAEEDVEDAGVLEDAGIVDGGIEVDGGLAADAAAP